MIGKLKGIGDSYGEDHVILDVQGVGYVVQCSARTLQRLPKPGEAAVLSIETHVREDATGSTASYPTMSATGSG